MMGAAKPNIGPATAPQPNAGNQAAAMNDLRNALSMMEKALPAIPLGSPLHSEILSLTSKLAKHLAPGDGNQGLELQSLLQMARQASQGGPMAALAKMGAPDGGGAAPPAMPAPPAMAA